MIVKVHSAVLDNWRITIRELSDEFLLSFSSVQMILTEDLGMKHVLAKFVPKLPKVKQKETCLAVARDLLQCADQDTNFMKTIITSDESWVCGYDLETKAQTSRWKTPDLWGRKDTPSSEQGVSDVDSFLQSRRHHSPQAHTGWSYHQQEYFVEVLCWLHDAVRCKRPVSWKRGDWQLHHDNAAACLSYLVQNFLAKHQFPQVLQPPVHLHGPVWLFSIPKGENSVEGE